MYLFIYVVLGVIFNDMGAYFIGMLFGKHKMNERISPKKTWEGFIGGVVISIIVSTVFALICALVEKPILPVFDVEHLYYVIIVSILIPLISDVGDFVFSSVKRTFGVKDFSNLLPGHGGVLDRIDSLIFASALVSCLIIFINLMLGMNINGIIS
jgi:phosphatidate cytidylyltransferase